MRIQGLVEYTIEEITIEFKVQDGDSGVSGMQLFTSLEYLTAGKSTDAIFMCMCKGKCFSVSQLMQMETKALFWLCPFESRMVAPLSIRQHCKDR